MPLEREEAEMSDAEGAVARWLADSEPLLVPIPVNDDVLVLSPPAA
jgi:hypothetical protein